MSSGIEDTALKMVGLELMFLTPEKYSHTDGITAVELAKLVNLPIEVVKKKLQIFSLLLVFLLTLKVICIYAKQFYLLLKTLIS